MKTAISMFAIALIALALNLKNEAIVAGLADDSTKSETESVSESAVESALICPVSKETISGEGVKYVYLGQEVIFCCEGCEKSFKKNPAKYLSGGLKDVVCGMTDGNKDISAVHDGVKYYFCNESCKTKFEKDPSGYLGSESQKDMSK